MSAKNPYCRIYHVMPFHAWQSLLPHVHKTCNLRGAMLLAHEVKHRTGEWLNLMHQFRGVDPNFSIILDNGEYEGSQVSLEELTRLHYKLLKLGSGLETVVPDRMMGLTSLQYSIHAMDNFDWKDIHSILPVQARRLNDCTPYLHAVSKREALTRIALPKCLSTDFRGNLVKCRSSMLDFMHNHEQCPESHSVHLLGGTRDWYDDQQALEHPLTRSMDTGIVFRYTAAGQDIMDSPESEPSGDSLLPSIRQFDTELFLHNLDAYHWMMRV